MAESMFISTQPQVSMSVLMEDTSNEARFTPEHGLGVWVEAGPHAFLFDTGKTAHLIEHARLLNIPLEKAERVVISHGHYDHTGGIPALLALNPAVTFHMRAGALIPRFHRNEDGSSRPVGVPDPAIQALYSHKDRVMMNGDPLELYPGVVLSGSIPRITDWEDTGGPFFLDAQGTQADPLADDQAVFLRLPQGLIILMGCCHAGLANTLAHAATLYPGVPLLAMVGGFHLLNASAERLQKTLDLLGHYPNTHFYPGHCTGSLAFQRLADLLGARYHRLTTGMRLQFPL